MKKVIICAILLFSGCGGGPAMMGGFQNGYMGYPPPQPYRLQMPPPMVNQNTQPRNTMGTIYTPRGPVLFNSTTY